MNWDRTKKLQNTWCNCGEEALQDAPTRGRFRPLAML
jgi:hypothetical protein